jgi:hypothetical protein
LEQIKPRIADEAVRGFTINDMISWECFSFSPAQM